MTISIKSPTSTTGSIQKNGSDVITIDASDNVTVANDLTATSFTGDGSQLTGLPSSYAGTKNLIINGNMQIAQRATSSSSYSTGDTYLTLDRWRSNIVSSGTWTMSQDTDVPTGQGFASSMKWDCTTANASLPTNAFMYTLQSFEGQNLQQLKKGTSNAEPVTLSFWVKSNKTGTYTVFLYDIDNTRLISKAYTVDVADTWEKKTITYAGDTTGALDNNNGRSLDVRFMLASGTDWSSGTLQTSWAANVTANRAVGQVNLADSTSNYINITGVQLEVGDTATDFENLQYGQQLALCQRYYEQNYGTNNYEVKIQGITSGLTNSAFKVSKRADATTTVYSSVTQVAGTVNNGNGNVQTAISSVISGKESFWVSMAGTSSQVYTYYFKSSAEL